MQARQAYDALIQHHKQVAVLSSCSALLGWDEETYMPAGGAVHRGEQQALLAGITHERRTDPRIGEWLAAIEGSSLVAEPTSVEAVNVREIRRNYDRATRLPQRLVEELARTTSLAQKEWAQARKTSDFAHFEPWLTKILELKREEADALGHNHVRYDALLDGYEPGARADELTPIFAELREQLVPLVAAIRESKRQPNRSIVRRDFPIDRQAWFGESAAAAIGFDFQKGRLDSTTHPFCSGIGPGDCRITTRYNPNYFNDAFFSILHEAGHGLYEQGLPAEHYGTPMGDTVSLGIHESQSRMWENLVGRSLAFWRHFFPRAQQTFPCLRDVALGDFHFAINQVEPSFIRVDADEVTYNLHVMVRFELELAMLAGDLSAKDVPTAWNEKYEKYLGITPPEDRLGCLQDVHWSFGLIGYFPTYTLGNMAAAQLFEAAERELGGITKDFSLSEFHPLLDWLRTRVHSQGQRYRPNDLIQVVTGKPLTSEALVRNLREKYGSLYRV